MAEADADRFQANLQAEIDGAALYRALATIEKTPEVAEVYRALAGDEERHAEIWRERLRDRGLYAGDPPPTWRTRTLIALARLFGPAIVLSTVLAHERADSLRYQTQADAAANGLPEQERAHVRAFQRLAERAPGGVVGGTLARLET
ncbi:MAG: rubrerythrin family protein, partial [Thermomicrobiaceae bacterium]|nr:rubrerythrin family protein [Thermomicrobiaceae bacterium]